MIQNLAALDIGQNFIVGDDRHNKFGHTSPTVIAHRLAPLPNNFGKVLIALHAVFLAYQFAQPDAKRRPAFFGKDCHASFAIR